MTADRVRIGFYAFAAAAGATLVVSIVLLTPPVMPLADALQRALPPSLVLAVLGMASRFACRAMPLRRTPVSRVIATHGASAAAAASVWMLVWRTRTPLVFTVGAILYLGMVTLHYLTLEVEAARDAEEAALRFQVLAREAERKALEAQVDPHFLFNSLNAVAALCGSRPHDARAMAQLMADFYRLTLRIGGRERIALADELELVSRYLAIEKVRFGARLETRIDVDDAARGWLVPPLLLQPLVENAVRHGIASVVDGGTIEIDARAADGVLRVRIDNPADPDRPQPRGESIGLANARGRLAAISGGRASLATTESGGRYRVDIEVPA